MSGGVSMKEEKAAVIQWNNQARSLELEGEPVLEYTLSWPELKGAGLGGRWINAYYAHLAKSWQRRWEREVYWKACLELAQRRQAARPFTAWKGELKGEAVLNENGLLSLRFTGLEIRGDGRPNRVRWGDVWKVRQGAPCPLRELCGRGWRERLWKELRRQGEERRQGGDCFLDRDWEKKARAAGTGKDCCLTQEGIEVSISQGAAAPAAEGCPVFLVEWDKVLKK